MDSGSPDEDEDDNTDEYIDVIGICENTNDVIKIQNEVCCFKNVVVFYKDEYSVVSGDFICTMVTKRFSVRNRERFTDHLKLVGKLDKTGFYLDELINWIAGKIKV